MKQKMCASLVILGLCLSTASYAAGKVHWTYSGEEGPQHWGALDPSFIACSTGKNQSPINLTRMVDGKLSKVKINYKSGGNEVINNGHAIEVNYAPGSSIMVDGHTFELKQFHFHSPSENTIEGRSFPLEGHYVHADKTGNLAVISVMFKEGKANAQLAKIWHEMPTSAGNTNALTPDFSASSLLPKNHDYYRFNGSLTTPPCSEGVTWLVMKNYDTISKAQIEKFKRIMGHPDNRPVQPINARVIIK